MAKNLKVLTTTISASGTASDAITLQNSRIPLAIETPSALTGTTLTFKSSSSDGGTLLPIYYEGTLYSVTVSTSRHVALDRRAMEGVRYFQIVSGSTESSSRTFNVITGE